MICSVSGMLYENAQLLSNVPPESTTTCAAHVRKGTSRAFKRGIHALFQVRNEGRDWRVTNRIWEKVMVDPMSRETLRRYSKVQTFLIAHMVSRRAYGKQLRAYRRAASTKDKRQEEGEVSEGQGGGDGVRVDRGRVYRRLERRLVFYRAAIALGHSMEGLKGGGGGGRGEVKARGGRGGGSERCELLPSSTLTATTTTTMSSPLLTDFPELAHLSRVQDRYHRRPES